MVSQLGDNIIDFFGSSRRGVNAGKNDQGVEVEYLLISTEVSSSFDNSINNVATNNRYTGSGPDCLPDRSTLVRDGFSFFRGTTMTPPPGSLSFADRRRIVVIDATDPTELVIKHNAQPLSSGALGEEIVSAVREAVNSVAPAPMGLSYDNWRSGMAFPSGLDGPNDDPDGDHDDNLLEFFTGSDPVDAASRAQGVLTRTPTGFLYTYRRAREIVGVTHTLQAGALENLVNFTPEASDVTTTAIGSEVAETSVALPPDFGPYLRQSVSME
jgi:hypothetical protein